MAIVDRSATVTPGKIERLHLSVAKRCSVEIIEGRDTVVLSRRLNAVDLDVVGGNFAALKTAQTIPWGTIRASVRTGGDTARIRYRVRTGRDMSGVPELDGGRARAAAPEPEAVRPA